MKSFKILFILSLLFSLIASPLFSLSLKERFLKAKAGSYIVIESQDLLTLMRIHSVKEEFLYLEEISTPAQSLPAKEKNWNNWIAKKAPSHSSWLLYEIDLEKATLSSCYDIDQNTHIDITNQPSFLATLMNLKLTELTKENRKKIGPRPSEDSADNRKIWNPPKIVEGKKIASYPFEAFRTSWPSDGSELSSRTIDVYLDENDPSFPFPYWIEIGDTHNVLKIRVVDSGINTSFFLKTFPHKPLAIKAISLDVQKGLEIDLDKGPSLTKFQLLAFTKELPEHFTIPLPHTTKMENGELKILVEKNMLQNHLISNLSYQFIVIPIEAPEAQVESRQSFLWR